MTWSKSYGYKLTTIQSCHNCELERSNLNTDEKKKKTTQCQIIEVHYMQPWERQIYSIIFNKFYTLNSIIFKTLNRNICNWRVKLLYQFVPIINT